jgi:hypothetical protein
MALSFAHHFPLKYWRAKRRCPSYLADVDFEYTAKDADISGEAKRVGKTELVMKSHSESEASFCEQKIQLSPNEAKVQQSNDCDNFTVGNCHFSSNDKKLIRIK